MRKINDFIHNLGISLWDKLSHYDFSVKGAAVPEQAILASNHYGSFDPILLSLGLKRRFMTFTLRHGRYFAAPYFLPDVGRIVLENGYDSFLEAKDYKERKYSFLLFTDAGESKPNGEREIESFGRGAVVFARHLDLPLVPVSLKGVEKIWPYDSKRRLPNRNGEVLINVGSSIELNGSNKELAGRLRHKIIGLYDEY